jgi:hypothetical protein
MCSSTPLTLFWNGAPSPDSQMVTIVTVTMRYLHGIFLRIRDTFLLSIYDSNESIDFVHGKSKKIMEVLDELELFIDKKVILDEKNFSVGPPHSGV